MYLALTPYTAAVDVYSAAMTTWWSCERERERREADRGRDKQTEADIDLD